MKFTVKDIKITLRSESGETIVVEESCDPPDDKRPKSKAEAKPEREKKVSEKPAGPRTDAAEPKEPRAAAPTDAPKAKAASGASRSRTAPKKADAPAADDGARRTPSSLAWKPHAEFGYNGVAAKDGKGTYKLLKSRSTKWGLYYDQVGVDSVPIGCYNDIEDGKTAAQEQHDKGMPDRRRIPQVCPADAPAAPPKPAAAPEGSDVAPTLTPEMRAEMMSGMKDAIRTAMENVP